MTTVAGAPVPKLDTGDEDDRRFVLVSAAVLNDGLKSVEAVLPKAIAAGEASDDVILHILPTA